jgi:uncharacterized coiled-coil protein SlyX
MDQYNDSLILAKRNIAALSVALDHQEKKRAELEAIVTNMGNQLAANTERVQSLTMQLAMLRVKEIGHGSS